MGRMPSRYDCAVPAHAITGLRAARTALAKGGLVVVPTDTVYGIAADAFRPAAVQALLDAKGRGRQSPPPVLVPDTQTLGALAEHIDPVVERLVEAFWPGGLTIVLPAQPSLAWDLGETRGTVALRQPDHPITLELLADTGPLAVSSANLTGRPPARDASEAEAAFGDAVAVYLDAGRSPEDALSSTIVDATALEQPAEGTGLLRVLRWGAVDRAALKAVIGSTRLEDAAP